MTESAARKPGCFRMLDCPLVIGAFVGATPVAMGNASDSEGSRLTSFPQFPHNVQLPQCPVSQACGD